MKSPEKFKRFVQNTLGCQCPAEVFDKIELKSPINENRTQFTRITVGERLLIYIWEPGVDDADFFRSKFLEMLAAGKNERDRRGLNRFRAVIAADNLKRAWGMAHEVFNDFAKSDEKLHFHVVSVLEIRAFQ